MKPEKRIEARELRKNGDTIKKIANTLGVSKSSVSLWVRDIELTPEQIKTLEQLNPIFNRQISGAKGRSDKARIERVKYQEAGKLKAKENDALHQAGCMLYWAEGTKDRASCKFSNSDPNMLRFFIKFLSECYSVQKQQIRARINCYTNNGISIEEIELYWSNMLELSKECFTKSTTNCLSTYSQQKKLKNKLPYGTVSLDVHNVALVQNIYGAIQEYANFNCDYCID